MQPPETLRTFIAVPLSDDIIRELDKMQRHIRHSAPDCVRWVTPPNIHLTLQFLGDVLLERLSLVREALTVVARNMQPFEIQVKGLGAFPNTRHPRVVWVGVEDTTSWLALLQTTVEEAMARLGFQPETRAFSPHLTLGRVNRGVATRTASELGAVLEATDVGLLGTMKIEEVILFQSTLKPHGAEYTPLARFHL